VTEVAADTVTATASAPPARVVITDIDIPVGSMVNLLVKLAFASVPALLILGLIAALLVAVIGGLGQLGLS
jgi:hypothetical protein